MSLLLTANCDPVAWCAIHPLAMGPNPTFTPAIHPLAMGPNPNWQDTYLPELAPGVGGVQLGGGWETQSATAQGLHKGLSNEDMHDVNKDLKYMAEEMSRSIPDTWLPAVELEGRLLKLPRLMFTQFLRVTTMELGAHLAAEVHRACLLSPGPDRDPEVRGGCPALLPLTLTLVRCSRSAGTGTTESRGS